MRGRPGHRLPGPGMDEMKPAKSALEGMMRTEPKRCGCAWSWTAVVMASSIMAAVGCSGSGSPGRPPTYPATGTVSLDGKPVAGATITLVPQGGGQPAVAVTDPSGGFRLTTFQAGDGAVAGTYGVTVEKRVAPGAAAADGAEYQPPTGPLPPPENVLPAKYASVETSGLAATIEAGRPNTFTLDLTAK